MGASKGMLLRRMMKTRDGKKKNDTVTKFQWWDGVRWRTKQNKIKKHGTTKDTGSRHADMSISELKLFLIQILCTWEGVKNKSNGKHGGTYLGWPYILLAGLSWVILVTSIHFCFHNILELDNVLFGHFISTIFLVLDRRIFYIYLHLIL